MFSTAIPVLFGLGCLYFWLAAWIDRHNLLRNLTPPPRSSAVLMHVVTVTVFPIAVALHVLLGIFFFEGSDSSSVLPWRNFSSNTSWMTTPPSAPPGDTFADRDKSYTLTVEFITAAMMAIGVVLFYMREMLNWYGVRTRLSPTQRRFLTTFFFHENEDDADLEVVPLAQPTDRLLEATPPRNEYLPPLPSSLLALLRLRARDRLGTSQSAALDASAHPSRRSFRASFRGSMLSRSFSCGEPTRALVGNATSQGASAPAKSVVEPALAGEHLRSEDAPPVQEVAETLQDDTATEMTRASLPRTSMRSGENSREGMRVKLITQVEDADL